MFSNKYILAEGCQILPSNEVHNMTLPDVPERHKLLAERLFILAVKKRLHLINPTIKQFLEAFNQPATLNQVIGKFAQMAGCHTYEIRIQMTQFFEDMLDRGVLNNYAQQLKFVRGGKTENSFSKGQKIGPFQIIREICRKSGVEIYLARQMEKNKVVVLKFLKGHKQLTKTALKEKKEAFLQEFRLMQELGKHRNICQCLGYVNSSRHCYGILEFAEGESLRSYIKQQQPPLADRLVLIKQVLSAMSFIHQHKILHGDIHLSNFIVNQSTLSIKLIDFNLSNREMPEKGEIIREGGVFQYIPPEKLDNRAFHLVKDRSDYCSEVFQLGVVCYYILYGKMPFEAFSWQALAHKIREERPLYLTETSIGESIPNSLIDMLKKSLEKDPGQRYSSAVYFFKPVQALNR